MGLKLPFLRPPACIYNCFVALTWIGQDGEAVRLFPKHGCTEVEVWSEKMMINEHFSMEINFANQYGKLMGS